MSENTRAANLERRISTTRERLTDLLTEWGADFSMLPKELEEKRVRLQEVEAAAASQPHALEAARAALDARESLIENLRGEAERAQVLEAQLEEKRKVISKLEAYIERHERKVISKLEAYIERHVSALTELRQSAANWKEKYAALNSPNPSSDATTISDLPQLAEEETEILENVEDVSADRTYRIAINEMRQRLMEANKVARSPKGLSSKPGSALSRS